MPDNQAQHALTEAVSDFFNPHPPFSGNPRINPVELAVELATQWLVSDGKEKAIQILKNGIATVLETRTATKGRVSWDEADVLCSQALSLYLQLADEPGLGWVERDKKVLSYFSALFWLMPDRVVESREEKTNCTDYLVDMSCMLKSKEVIFSWVTERWDLNPNVYEPSKGNVTAAFDFVCEVFKQDKRGSSRKTSAENIKVLTSYECSKYPGIRMNHHSVDERRLLMDEDKKLYGRILKEHCTGITLERIRPWVRDDLPDGVLQLFQDVLLRSGDRSTALLLLKGESAAA